MYLTIVGRPNVGKSTLFNRLCRQKSALVFDRPGVTRDRKEGKATITGVDFTICDTAGIDAVFKAQKDLSEISLEAAMQQQIKTALQMAHVLLLVIDGREDLTPEDKMVANILRKLGKPVIVVVNKCEKQQHLWNLDEAYALGFSHVVPISAEHGEGISDLYEKILIYNSVGAKNAIDINDEQSVDQNIDQHIDSVKNRGESFSPSIATIETDTVAEDIKPLKLTIIGRPNAGKSTLTNALLKEDRMVISDEPGTTRDAICNAWEYEGRKIDLIDTAGLRRRSRIDDIVEKYAVQDTLKAIKFSEVVILVIDAQAPLEKQDLTLARYTVEEGRALIIAVNKIDCIKNPKTLSQTITEKLEVTLGQARNIEVVFISAKNKLHLDILMEKVFCVYTAWNKRVPTGLLNRWLESTLTKHPPPLSANGRRIRIKYITQIKTRPPTFALFSSHPADLPLSYHRYLENSLRDWVDLSGVPLRMIVKGSKNPYVKDK